MRESELADMELFAGSAGSDLAARIAQCLDINLGRLDLRRFSDGEVYVELVENVRGKSVYVLQSMSAPVNDHLMELLLLADAAKRASAKEITAIVPYLGYSRQDRRSRSMRVPISARVIADMLTAAGFDRLLTMDLHSEQIQGFYRIPVDNIYGMPVLLGDMATVLNLSESEGIVVAPDTGGIVRARAFSSALGIDLAIVDKRRPHFNRAKVMHIIGDVADKCCLIVDDIVDTANTLCEAATSLKERGAKRVFAYCTHAVLSKDAISRVNASDIDEMVVCDTVPTCTRQSGRIRVLTVSHVLAETLSRIHRHESISSLF